MRIVAWNIRAGGGGASRRSRASSGAGAPDVVALGEFRATAPSAGLACALAAHGLVHQRSTADAVAPGANCLLVASRWPLRRIRFRATLVTPIGLQWAFSRTTRRAKGTPR